MNKNAPQSDSLPKLKRRQQKAPVLISYLFVKSLNQYILLIYNTVPVIHYHSRRKRMDACIKSQTVRHILLLIVNGSHNMQTYINEQKSITSLLCPGCNSRNIWATHQSGLTRGKFKISQSCSIHL